MTPSLTDDLRRSMSSSSVARTADPVSLEEVLRRWCARELRERDDPREAGTLAIDEVVDVLLEHTSGAVQKLCVERRGRTTRWYRTEVTVDELRSVRVIESPLGLGWETLAPDDRLMTAVEAMRSGADVPEDLINGDKIRALADAGNGTGGPADGSNGNGDRIILFRPPADGTPRVVDGNHRSAAPTATAF